MLNAYVILSVLYIFMKPKISIANFWVRKMHAELLGFYAVMHALIYCTRNYVTDEGSNDHSFSLWELLRGTVRPISEKKSFFSIYYEEMQLLL